MRLTDSEVHTVLRYHVDSLTRLHGNVQMRQRVVTALANIQYVAGSAEPSVDTALLHFPQMLIVVAQLSALEFKVLSTEVSYARHAVKSFMSASGP